MLSNFSYQFPPRALERWARDRLEVVETENNVLVATFSYEGSTCSDGGIPVEIDLSVELLRAGERFFIQNAALTPRPGDRGCPATCAGQKKLSFFENRAAEASAAFHGRWLDEVAESLGGELNPAGCLCTQAHRNHKWLILLNTVHFALHQREKALEAQGG